MSTEGKSLRLLLEPEDNQRLANLCGQYNEHLQQVESHFKVQIHHRGHIFHITGTSENADAAKKTLQRLYSATIDDLALTPAKIYQLICNAQHELSKPKQGKAKMEEPIILRTKRSVIKCSSAHQATYLKNILNHDINFGIGPAGTGKTYLAVACAVSALEKEQVQRILLVRPAVEAGEKLGFLPGDLAEKVNPYLRPLYDALYEMMGMERVAKLIEQDVIEVAPLAYMRGRTLNDAFIILDEGQNTTEEQMKMFLTRIGFGSKVIVTGDITQIDLPKHIESGLIQAMHVLKTVKGISFTYFDAKDAVRHPLVQFIIEAYDAHPLEEKVKRRN